MLKISLFKCTHQGNCICWPCLCFTGSWCVIFCLRWCTATQQFPLYHSVVFERMEKFLRGGAGKSERTSSWLHVIQVELVLHERWVYTCMFCVWCIEEKRRANLYYGCLTCVWSSEHWEPITDPVFNNDVSVAFIYLHADSDWDISLVSQTMSTVTCATLNENGDFIYQLCV